MKIFRISFLACRFGIGGVQNRRRMGHGTEHAVPHSDGRGTGEVFQVSDHQWSVPQRETITGRQRGGHVRMGGRGRVFEAQRLCGRL